jgi:GTP cyclohydrolase II
MQSNSGTDRGAQESAQAGSQVRPTTYRLDYVASSKLPTPWATFHIHIFTDPANGKEHLALTLGNLSDGQPVLARVHSECLTGDAFFSQRCDCGAQLETAMQAIARAGRGMILYLRQEGRGIGLVNKIRAYQLQDQGADTVEANEQLGFPADMRRYDLCKPMLDHFGVTAVQLLTNNPRKVRALEELGVKVVERLPIQVNRNPFNEGYLSVKAAKLGHWLKEHF